jgi:hypothetical protein
MFESNERAGVAEQYAAACGSSNLRVGNDPTIGTPGDMIAAAGMNKHRMGLALRRLLTEWDAAMRKRELQPLSIREIEALARSLRVEPASSPARDSQSRIKRADGGGRLMVPNPNAGLHAERVGGKEQFRLPLVVAHEMAVRIQVQRLTDAIGRLKSLPTVRDGLIYEFNDPHVVARVIEWWLAPKCGKCEGRGEKVLPGTKTTTGKPCKDCRGTGEQDPPHGVAGMRIANYIKGSLSAAAHELRSGFHGWKREADEQGRRDAAARKGQVAAMSRNPDISDPQTRALAEEYFALGKRRLRG